MSDQKEQNPQQEKLYSNGDLLESVKEIYLNTKSCDVNFSFNSANGPGKRVAAHKCLLAASSDVFNAMFYGDLKEPGDVHLADSSDAAFMEFLQFFYLSDVKLTMENITEVMYLGQKYNVKGCISVCVEFLKDNLTAENVCSCLDLAILYDHNDLVKMCEKIIILDTVAVFKSVDFLECNKRASHHILKMDLLSCSEVDVFEACMNWVTTTSEQQILSKAIVDMHLGDLFYEIRFKSMTMQQFCTLHTD